MNKFFNIKVVDINLKKIILLNLLVLSLISVISYIYGSLFLTMFPDFVDAENRIIIKNFQFDYGELLHSLYYDNEYKQPKHEIIFYLLRLPLLPIFTNLLLNISLDFYVFIILKNTLLFTILNLSILYFAKKFNLKFKEYLIILLLFLYNPYNLHVLLYFNFADSYNSFLIPIFFLMMLINNKKSVLIGSSAIFLIYLSKSFLFLICIFYPLIDFIFSKFFKKNSTLINFKFISLSLGVLAAVLGWGFFGKVNANYFPIGSNASSYNSYALSSMLNEDFKNIYPEKSVDHLLDKTIFDQISFGNEKDFYNFFNEKNKDYIKNNSINYLNDIKIKIYFIFFSLLKDGQELDDVSQLRYSNIFNKPLLILSIIVSSYLFLIKRDEFSFQFLLITTLYLTPLIIGWATNKHLVPIFLISKIYLFLIYAKKN